MAANPDLVVRLVDDLLARAVRENARAIHVEPAGGRYRLRYRVGTALLPVQDLPADIGTLMIARLKILADLDMAERHLPQDGRLTIASDNGKVTFAVSTAPTAEGCEAAVLRPLLGLFAPRPLDGIGWDETDLACVRAAIGRRGGMILLAGPTWSGKHSTVHSLLRVLAAEGRTVATAEWVLRDRIPGVRHAVINGDIGLNFAALVRTYRRQDVDAVFVGEILDFETLDTCAHAALSGTLILSTIHAHDAQGAITRLANMGIEPWLIADTVSLVIAQRVLPKLCIACRVYEEPDPAALRRLGVVGAAPPLFRRGGCDLCSQSGFAGSALAYEMLEMTPAVAAHLRSHGEAPPGVPARRLREHALSIALRGDTTIGEVLRLTPG